MTSEYLLPFQRHLIDEAEICLAEIDAGGNSHGILLIGESGAGKTHALDVLAHLYPPYTQGSQPKTPCCRVGAPAKADAGTVAADVLRQLGKPLTKNPRKNVADLERDMACAMAARQVRILVLEEFHNALLAGTPQLRGQTARLLKNIWNQVPSESPLEWSSPNLFRGDRRLLVIVSGTEELLPVFTKDAELRSRFGCVIRAPRLEFEPVQSFKEFRYILRSLIHRFGLSEVLNAEDVSIAARSLFACSSHLRALEKLLQRAGTLARRSEAPDSLLQLMAAAYEQVGGGSLGLSNPFQWPEDELKQKVANAQANLRLKAGQGKKK